MWAGRNAKEKEKRTVTRVMKCVRSLSVSLLFSLSLSLLFSLLWPLIHTAICYKVPSSVPLDGRRQQGKQAKEEKESKRKGGGKGGAVLVPGCPRPVRALCSFLSFPLFLLFSFRAAQPLPISYSGSLSPRLPFVSASPRVVSLRNTLRLVSMFLVLLCLFFLLSSSEGGRETAAQVFLLAAPSRPQPSRVLSHTSPVLAHTASPVLNDAGLPSGSKRGPIERGGEQDCKLNSKYPSRSVSLSAHGATRTFRHTRVNISYRMNELRQGSGPVGKK